MIRSLFHTSSRFLISPSFQDKRIFLRWSTSIDSSCSVEKQRTRTHSESDYSLLSLSGSAFAWFTTLPANSIVLDRFGEAIPSVLLLWSYRVEVDRSDRFEAKE
jgi:hypothetical protein